MNDLVKRLNRLRRSIENERFRLCDDGTIGWKERYADEETLREAIAAFERADKKVTVPDALGLAIAFHTTYERLAPAFGYETRSDTKQFDPTSVNGRLMVAVCKEILSLSLAEKPEGMVMVREAALRELIGDKWPSLTHAELDDHEGDWRERAEECVNRILAMLATAREKNHD